MRIHSARLHARTLTIIIIIMNIHYQMQASAEKRDRWRHPSIIIIMAVVTPEQIESRLKEALAATHVQATDLSDGCGAKFEVLVVSSSAFEGSSAAVVVLLLLYVCGVVGLAS